MYEQEIQEIKDSSYALTIERWKRLKKIAFFGFAYCYLLDIHNM